MDVHEQIHSIFPFKKLTTSPSSYSAQTMKGLLQQFKEFYTTYPKTTTFILGVCVSTLFWRLTEKTSYRIDYDDDTGCQSSYRMNGVNIYY